NANDQKAESNSNRAAVMNIGNGVAEESEKHASQIHEHDSSGGGHHAQLEIFGNPNHSGTVGKQKTEQRSKCQSRRFHRDSMKLLFEHRGNAANHKAFE